jgi:hypothetical protein
MMAGSVRPATPHRLAGHQLRVREFTCVLDALIETRMLGQQIPAPTGAHPGMIQITD